MTTTLRIAGGPNHGEPVGAGYVATYHHTGEPRGIRNGSRFEVDNWSVGGAFRVYARPPGHTPKAPLVGFSPSELGLYIGVAAGRLASWPSSGYDINGPPEPRVRAELIVEAYEKARKRALDCPDALLSRAMATGVQDLMLQLLKLNGAGHPATEVLLHALTSDASLERARGRS